MLFDIVVQRTRSVSQNNWHATYSNCDIIMIIKKKQIFVILSLSLCFKIILLKEKLNYFLRLQNHNIYKF